MSEFAYKRLGKMSFKPKGLFVVLSPQRVGIRLLKCPMVQNALLEWIPLLTLRTGWVGSWEYEIPPLPF